MGEMGEYPRYIETIGRMLIVFSVCNNTCFPFVLHD